MTDESLTPVLNDFVSRALSSCGKEIRKIIFFGSRTRADYDDESDIDLMVLIESDNFSRVDRLLGELSFEFSLENDVLFSVITKDYSQFAKYLDVLPFYTNVQNQGITLYG